MAGLAMIESRKPRVEMKNAGTVSAAVLNMQSAAVGQLALAPTHEVFGSENVMSVLMVAGSLVAARVAPPAPCE